MSIKQAEFIEFEGAVLGTQFSHTPYFYINHPICKYLVQISLDPEKKELTADLKERLKDIGSVLLNAFGAFMGWPSSGKPPAFQRKIRRCK